MKNPLTSRQKQLLEFIQNQRAQGDTPTVREMADFMGIRNHNGVKCHLDALVAKGFVTVKPNVSRGVRLVGKENAS